MNACTLTAPLRQWGFKKTEYQHTQAALLPVEGIGAHGNFFIRIATRVSGPNLYVSARGYTPAMELPEYRGAFRFYGNVKLLEAGRQIIRKQLDRQDKELWPNDRYIPIGSAFVCIPPKHEGLLSLELEAGYELNTGTGFVTPIPPTGRPTIPLVGRS